MTARGAVPMLSAAALAVLTSCGGDDGTGSPATVAPTAPMPPTIAPTTTGTTPPTRAPMATVSSFVVELVDTTRTTPVGADDPIRPDRSLPTDVYLPASSEPAPLIVLAHGMDGHPDKFTELATRWAEAGYAVAAPAFPMSNRDAPDLDLGAAIADIAGQAGDISFVIDEMIRRNDTDGRIANRVDTERIGLFGLSLGSITTWTTLLGDCCDENRVAALIQSDGAPLVSSDGLAPISPERLAGLQFPVMLAHSDSDATLPYDDVRAEYEALPEGTVFLTLHGFAHATVAEDTETPADDAFRQATTTFWDRRLGGIPDAAFPDAVELEGVTTLEQSTPRPIPATK